VTKTISEFQEAVYQKITSRPAAILDMVDALTVSGHVNSPVALSESPLFRRKFSSVYDALVYGEFKDDLRELIQTSQDENWGTIAGYEIHAVDATPNERMSAETLEDRGALKANQKDPVRYGHKYSWLVRLVEPGTSWAAPEDVKRISTETTDTKVAAEQVTGLAGHDKALKVVTADSRYRDKYFLSAFVDLKNTYALVRLQNNQTLSEKPTPKPEGSLGAPTKHGAAFQLTAIKREPDASETFQLGKQTVRVRVWFDLHFKRIAKLTGSVVCIEFLKEDGTPRYKRPIWLFWTGPKDVSPQDLCRMYLWRFAIEHLFRFLKQNLGLNSNRSSNLKSLERWTWVVALAYWQLLLLRKLVQVDRPAWHPRKKDGKDRPLTPAQVQRTAQAFLLQSGSPAHSTRPAGKGRGRRTGYCPAPRKRFDVVFKTKKAQNQPKNC
jgi:hypothetical protein